MRTCSMLIYRGVLASLLGKWVANEQVEFVQKAVGVTWSERKQEPSNSLQLVGTNLSLRTDA